MNINSILYSPKPESKTFAQKNSHIGILAPLKADTVSFRGNKIVQNAHIHLEWIDNKSIRDLVERILAPSGKPNSLKKSEAESILKYFGFDMDSWSDSGDDRKYHRTGHSKLDNYFTINQHRSANSGLIQDLRDALMIVDDMNGELISVGKKQHDKDFYEKFKEQTREYSPSNTNRYRKYWQADYDNKLQQEKLKQEQELEAQKAAFEEERKADEITQTQQKQDEAIEFGKKLELIAKAKFFIQETKIMRDEKKEDIKYLKEGLEAVKDVPNTIYSIYRQEMDELESDIIDFLEKNKDSDELKKKIRKLNSIKNEYEKLNSDEEIASEATLEKLQKQKEATESTFFFYQDYYEGFNKNYEQLMGRVLALIEKTNPKSSASDRIAKFKERYNNGCNNAKFVKKINNQSSSETKTESAKTAEVEKSVPETKQRDKLISAISQEVVTQCVPQSAETTRYEISPYGNSILNNIARNITTLNRLNIFFHDIKSQVKKAFTPHDFENLKNASDEEFRAIIQSKIQQLGNLNEIKQIRRSQKFAIMNEIIDEGKMTPEKLYTTSPMQIDKWITTLSKLPQGGREKLDFEGIEQKYIKLRGHLDKNDAKQIAKLFISCFGNIPSQDYNNLMMLLATEGKYFNLLTDAKSHKDLKAMLLEMLVSDFDNSFGTNYSSNINQAQSNLKRNGVLNNIEMYTLLKNIW